MLELWVKAIHVMAVIAWMAGLFYLPRLYVYHTQADAGSELSETLKVMERKLLRVIMNPAMIMAWIFGLTAAYLQGQFFEIWFVVKFVLVLAMSLFHGLLVKWRTAFESDANLYSEKFYRRVNEVPTVLMAGIVIMVIVKPV